MYSSILTFQFDTLLSVGSIGENYMKTTNALSTIFTRYGKPNVNEPLIIDIQK